MYTELLIGCGRSRDKRIFIPGQEKFKNLVTLDMTPEVNPDLVWNLEDLPLPFKDNSFDEIHAYEVLEHVGKQGDWKFFFKQFDDFARILKPNGILAATSPNYASPWVWGDPGHTRFMGQQVYTFLVREEYDKQQGKTAMTDYRPYFTSSWLPVFANENGIVIQNLKDG